MGERAAFIMGASDQYAPDVIRTADVPRQAKWWLWALVAVTLLGGALRFFALSAKTLWLDEAFSLWMARHDLPSLFEWLIYIDHHPPLYYIFLHTWIEWFGDSPSALRSLSALTSTAAIPFYALAGRKLIDGRVGIIAALLLAISPFHIRYAQETRMYGVLTLAVALLLLVLAHLLTSGDDSPHRHRWAWVLLAVTEAAAMLTHNTATILVPLTLNAAIGGLWLLQRRGWASELVRLARRHFYRSWLLSQFGALLLWSPWAMAFVRQAQVVDGDFWIEAPKLWDVWTALGNLTYAYLPAWLPQRDYLTWLAVGLVVWGIWSWRRSGAVTWLLLCLWLLPPAVELLASLRRPIFYDRTIIWTTLPYYLLIGRGIVLPQGVRRGWHVGWLLLTLSLVGALCVLGVWNYYSAFEKEDWDEAALFVAKEVQSESLILFHASWAELPFDYYYPADAPPLERHGVPADLFDAGALEPPMTEADVPRVLALIAGRDDIWLVYSHWWYTDPAGLLLRVLDEELMVAEEREWSGIRVIRYHQE